MNTQLGLKEWLATQGFREYENGMAAPGNECRWYACKRIPSQYMCELNDDKNGIQIVIYPYEYRAHEHQFKSVEIDLTGEAGGVWYKLQAYSLSWEELPNKLDAITDGLVKAWEALPR